MSKTRLLQTVSFQSVDSKPLAVVHKDFSGGVNTREHPSSIEVNQCEKLENWDTTIVGELVKRYGSSTIGSDLGDAAIVTLHNYEIQGATDQLLAYEDTNLSKWIGAGTFASLKADFTASTDVGMVSGKMSGIAPDDIVIIQNGEDNAFSVESDGTVTDLGSTTGTGSDSPPQSTVMAWYGNRFWVLKNDLLYWSAAYSADYSSAFDTVSDSFRIPVGEERFIAPTRDAGMIIGGEHGIWAIAPSATPVATDRPQPIITSEGCVSKKAWCLGGDDIYWFSQNGLRSLRRTVQDKLQMGATYPLTFPLKDDFDTINWAYAYKIAMVYFDNKIYMAVPTDSSTVNNEV